MGDFTYKVNVKATVSDETSGNVFAMLMSADEDASAIQAQVKDSTEYMVLLGSFSGPSSETLEGNLTTYFANVEAVIDNNPITLTANVDIPYYVYIYAIDQYGNDILIKHSGPVTLDINTSNVDVNTTLFIDTKTGLFHETRDAANITQAIVTSRPTDYINYFGYLANKEPIHGGAYTDYANVLYATLTANPGEFVVDAVYSFAVETPPPTFAGNETKFSNLIESTDPLELLSSTLLFDNSEPFPYKIDTFYANVDSNVKYPMVFGTNYTLYHACHVRGMDLYVINQAGNVSTGEAPTIVSSTAAVSSTEQEFITNVNVAYTSGTVEVTTTLNRGSDIGDKPLYLYTAAFGYAEYDHAALLANLDTFFNVELPIDPSSTSHTLTLSRVFDANGDDMNVTDTNAIFVYQFASVGRDADEIASGAPTSNVTDFDGGSKILSQLPKIAYDVTSNVTVYHYAEDFDHLTFKVDQSIPQTPTYLEAFARDLLVRYSAAVIDPSPKSYAVTWSTSVTIGVVDHPDLTKPTYFGGFRTYKYMEITQGSTLTFTFTSPHDLFESTYDATTDTFTGDYDTDNTLGSSPYTITFDDPGLRGFNCYSGHNGMNLVVKTIPSVVHRGRTLKGVVSDPIHTNHLGSAFNNLLDVESIVTIGTGITTFNYLVTTSELTGNVDIRLFS